MPAISEARKYSTRSARSRRSSRCVETMKGEWAESLPDWEVVEVGKVSIYMLHNVKEIDISPAGAGFHVVVSGHSHKPSVEAQRGVLYINPGSAGPRRFKLPVSVAHLHVVGEKAHAEIIELCV